MLQSQSTQDYLYFEVCVFSSHLFRTSNSLDVPAGVTEEEGHTGFLVHLPSAVRAFIFLVRRIQPFLSLADREVEFCVLTISSFSSCWAYMYVCMYGHTYSKSMDQPGKVANPARGKLNREN